jgi:SAM-dependent methyltransferase
MTSMAARLEARFDERVKCARPDGLAWYARQADERFWYEHWCERLSAGYYEAARQHDLARDEMGRVLLSHLPVHGTHLEAGCGAGYWVAALREHGFNVEGIEYSNELVALVNGKNPELPVTHGNALSIAAPDNSYASYLSFGVVEHSLDGPEAFLAEAYRVLEPGGRIILSVPFFGPVRRAKAAAGCYTSSAPDLPFYQFAWTRAQCRASLEAAGFRITAAQPLFVHRMLVEESRTYRWLSYARGGRFLRALADACLAGRDGHMLMMVGDKPAR